MTNLPIAEALKQCPADTELFAAWDYEDGKNWVVAWNEDLPSVDEHGEPCESGMMSHVVAVFESRKMAEDYVKKVYQLDAQLSEHGINLNDYIKNNYPVS